MRLEILKSLTQLFQVLLISSKRAKKKTEEYSLQGQNELGQPITRKNTFKL